ncbi:MAG: ribbon-helix-helix domain-containing protein [Exilispira sp.]|jgi:metal-responsive CopG/Arc/MetJ family transcriptional regulator|nr:ribbon-helix-helix domain-containing protein [Exilispira sp.]
MGKELIEVSEILLKEIDEMISNGYYNSRAEAVNDAVDQMIKKYKLSKLKEKSELQDKEKN